MFIYLAIIIIILIICAVLLFEPQSLSPITFVLVERVNDDLDRLDTQNVHEPGIRIEIWEKFYHLKDLIEKDSKELGENWFDIVQENSVSEAYKYSHTIKDKIKQKKMIVLLNRLTEESCTVTSTRKIIHKEKEIFSLVWHRFVSKKYDLDTFIAQLMDCFEENFNLLCITGRVSRYINSLSRIDEEDFLSQPEITQKALSQLALNKIKVYYDEFFDKNPKLLEIREKEISLEEEEKLYQENLKTLKKEIKEKIKKEFPDLEKEFLNKSLEGVFN